MAYFWGKPPAPYVYQEYPRRLYKWGEKPCSVASDDERAAKEAEGWSIDARALDTPPVAVVADEAPVHSVNTQRKRRA